MGAQASCDAGANNPADPQDERLAARAWRTGVPFTLLHDEGFVVEKYQELLTASSTQSAATQSNNKALEEAQTTVSGLDEAPMDEMQHATDMARIKLFARAKREEVGAGEPSGSQPGSPSSSGPGAASTLTSSMGKENPPSALAGMVGNTLSRDSLESVDSERLRAQRDKLLQVYFEQIAARMRQNRVNTVEQTPEGEGLQDAGGGVAPVVATDSDEMLPHEMPIITRRLEISQGVTAASVFSVGSLRMQLEMLREFSVFSPRLFENGTMALVQTLLDSPPFALQDVPVGSPEDALLSDVHNFCRDVLHLKDEGHVLSDAQRQVLLLLLLAIGVSSGRVRLLLEFVDELLALPNEIATNTSLVQGYPFAAWVKVFMQRMQSYRIDFVLGTFEDSALVNKFAVKTLPGEVENEDTENGSEEPDANLSSSLATDGSFAYTWNITKGLAKIGTGLNFTIAGRVYSEMPANVYLQCLEEKRTVRKLVYGFGENAKDVSEVARDIMARIRATLPVETSQATVHDIFGAADASETFHEFKLLVSYYVNNIQNVCILEDEDVFNLPVSSPEDELAEVKVCRAWYGDLDVLSTEAVLEFCNLLELQRSETANNNDVLGVTLSHQLIEQLLTLTGIPLEKMTDSKKLMVVFACGDNSEFVGAHVLEEGDRFVDEEERLHDAYLSSLSFCGDSLYLNVMYPERDVSGMLSNEPHERCRQLLRISPQDLSFLENLPLQKCISSSFRTSGNTVECTLPLYVYVTDGRLIYEVDIRPGDIGVNVIKPKAIPGGGKTLEITREFILDEKTVLCCEFSLCLAKIRSTLISNDDRMEVQLPSFYTNGASLGMLIVDPNSQDYVSLKNRVHCMLFDCESGQAKKLHDNGEETGCLERSLSSISVCFDARNNFLWLYDEHKRVLLSYQNSGKRVPLDENSIPLEVASRKTSGGEESNFTETTALSLLGFLYKNAVASDGKDGEGNGSVIRIPFAVDAEVETFKLLLAFISKYVDIFKAKEASIVQVYILQACLGILNKNLESLLQLAGGRCNQESFSLLMSGLSTPLDKLLEFSSEQQDCKGVATEGQVPSRGSSLLQSDEKSCVQVASVALDLYTTSIRIFHSDVSKQFTHVLKYLQLWQQSTATRMELKILARLLAHLCTRVDAIYQSLVTSEDAIEQFLKLVEFAVGMQKRQLRRAFVGSDDISDDAAAFPDSNESSFELISLVNAITQASFVALCCASDTPSRKAFDVAVVVFDTIRDACSSICCDVTDHVRQQDCRTRWSDIEIVLKDGFVGILAPVVLSSGIMLLRNRKSIEAMLMINDDGGPENSGSELEVSQDLNGSVTSKSSALSSRLFEFLKDNSSKLLNFMVNLDALVSMIDPTKREHTVENISMTLKTETLESSHEYENNMDALTELQVPGATRMVITFDPRSRTEVNYDYLTFFKDKSQGEYYGSQFYSGRDSEQNWPGVGDNPPLTIENDRCFVYFHTDGSNTDWGYKFTATAEILERKKSLQQHWIVFLLESVVQLLDESIKLLVDGSAFAPIKDIEVQNEQYLQSDLLRSGVCTGDSKNAEVLRLLQDFVDPPESSDAEKVIQALHVRSGVSRPAMALARSTSFDQITSSAPNQCVNRAVRAVAAAILHHNMWGMDAYAFTQNLRDDISEQLLRGWKNAQKMRDWFHLGDAADAGIHGQTVPNRRRSGRLRRQPSAYKGLSEESLAILCDNVIKRARFLLEITPVSFAYVTGAKRRWGLLAKYGHAIGKQSSTDTQLDKWYNLLDELQAATELRSLFQYRRSSSERLKHGQVKSVTEQVLEFIQSDVDISEVQKVIDVRNRRAASRALGMEILIQALKNCPSLRLRGILLESFTSTLKSFAIANSPTNVPGSSLISPTSAMDSFPRLHFDTLLSGCDESLRQRIAEAFGNCLTIFAQQLASTPDNGTSSGLITAVLRCCAMDYDLEDSYLLQESGVLPQILRLLSSDSIPTRNAAQSLLGVLLSRCIAGRVESDQEAGDDDEYAVSDAHDVSVFQRQLFAAVGNQLERIVSAVKSSLNSTHDRGFHKSSPQYLPENSPGFTAPCLQQNVVSWNHSIMLWVYSFSKGPLYALKLGDEVRHGPNWSGTDELEKGETDTGTVVSIPTPTKVHVRWNSSGLTSQCEFDPKRGIFDVVLVDEGAGGTIFFKGNKNMIRDTAAAKPWSHFGLFLTDRRMLVYKIACGSDKESVFETDYEMDADQWSHVAIVQDEDILRVYVNGSMVSQHLLESFLVMNANMNPAESAIIESAHPLEDSIDEYCPVHIPGALKIRLTFDPLCDIDGSTGFVRFYKDAKCVDYWGEDKYTGKYSDPERNFPGAQSNRARSLQHAEASNVDLNVLEIPSDRFLVYFHNEGSSNSWGFRILAAPEFTTTEEESTSLKAHLNPYPFYFGAAPGRVLDEPAAKCWIYQPKVLNYSISESDLTTEIQTSFPSTEIVSNCVPSERTLHILGLIRTCAETSFGRSLIGTPVNLRDIMFLSFDDRVSVEIRIGAIRVLEDLVGILSPDIMDTQVAKALPDERDGFLSFVFKRLGRALNVWQAYEDDNAVVVDEDEEDADGALLELRTSAQGETSLVAAYISLLRGAAGYSCWRDQLFELVITGLQSVQAHQGKLSERDVGHILASLAILGGNYGGAYVGGRVSCCVNVDGKEMVETGFLVQFRTKSGSQIARVIFDCDQSSTVDVPLTDVAHLDDTEKTELALFLKRMIPFASELKDLYQSVLDLSVSRCPSGDSYQPKLTKKENVEVLESEHPYAAGEDVTYSLNFRGATEIIIRFDKLSCTAGPNDFIQFKKREGDLTERGGNDNKYWGEEKYYGESFPGVGPSPPLRIPAGGVDVHFHTESSSSGISEWGFKLTAHAFEETLTYPPEIPPAIMTSALSDIRARCIKSIGQVVESLKRADVVPTFTTLVPLLTKIANAPCDGRPIQSSPKSQIFESKHPYANSVMEYMKVTFSGASTLTIRFDPQSRTEQGCDYLCFFKDKSLTARWGAYQYCGVDSDANWPGVEDRPPLVIPADSFTLLWTTDASNVDWGWKFNVTAEFLPEFPLDKNLKQLDARSYRLFETLYEKMNHQRIPLKSEFAEFAETDNLCKEKQNSDPIRQLLTSCSSKGAVKLAEWGSITSRKTQQFRVAAEDAVKVYEKKNRDSNVLAELETGTEFIAEADLDGWLKVTSDNVNQLDKARDGWIWQRSGDTMHVSPLAACANGEDLLTLGVDDLNLEDIHSVLEMDESNDEEKSLISLCSPFVFDELKGQTDRIQSLAYDSHRAMATKAARDAILTFLSCDPQKDPIPLSIFGNAEDILLLLSHFFLAADSDAFDNQSGVLLALRKRLKHMVLSGVDDSILSAVVVRCLEILKNGPQLLPKGRGAVRTLESAHPYSDNADQYWDISIPGATKIKVFFDRRSRSEAGCDYVRLYKAGSNRTETIGPDQICGRRESENWPGTIDCPPLYIEGDSFEVYFHSDSSNNDWGFKLYAIGIFKEEDRLPCTDKKSPNDSEMVVKLLSMAGWLLEALSSISDSNFQASPTAFQMLYSAETLQTLMLSLDESPQWIKTCALQILSNMAQSAAFHTLPTVLIEHVRDLLNVKMRAKHQAEDRVKLKSPYFQALVQCAIAVDLSIDSHCFEDVESFDMGSICSLPYRPGMNDGTSTSVSSLRPSASGCYQFLLRFQRLVSTVTIGLMDGVSGTSLGAPNVFVQWEDNGKLSFNAPSNKQHLIEIPEYKGRFREGDTVIILLDLLRQTLTIRKNSIVAALVAGPAGSGALVRWDELHPSLHPKSDVRLVVSHSSPDNQIKLSSLSCSSIALIPQTIVPNWYGKVVDAVSMMLDFRKNLSSTVISRESRHPLASSAASSNSVRELINIDDAVAIEIRFDKRTIFQKSDELHFYSASKSGAASSDDTGDPYAVFSGINGEQDEKDMPHLFAPEGTKRPSYSLSAGELVVRSPDWEYSDEDGGAGNIGVVQEITSWGVHGGKGVRVRWQGNGFESVYRYGLNGRYDVQNVEHTKYHTAPLILRGSSISYEFVRSISQATTRLDLSTSSEFAGSLELDGSMHLDLKIVEEDALSKSDCSVEFWALISKDPFEKVGDSGRMEVLRIDGTHGRVVLLSDQLGRCTLALQAVDASGELVEQHQGRDNADNDSCASGNLVFGQWLHLALVFSGSRAFVVKNGDMIYSRRCSEHHRQGLGTNAALIFGNSSSHVTLPHQEVNTHMSCLAFCGHLYDIRLWDVAFRVEQLRSHFRGLDSVEVIPKSSSRPGTPTSAGRKPLSPSMTYVSSPRSPRPVAVPQHMRKWVTTNRTSKDVTTVRLNCSVKVPISLDGDEKETNDTAYYEAHALSSGKLCVGWILDGVDIHNKSTMIGEEPNAFGVDLGKKVAHFSTLTTNLASFTRVEPTVCSPRRFSGGSSFGNDIFCRNGDVIGCAINLATGKLTFCVNGTMVAEFVPSDDDRSDSPSTEEALVLDNGNDHEFDALVSEVITIETPTEISMTSDAHAPNSSDMEKRFYPCASLGPQGAQGLAWNFGQRPFKYEPDADERTVLCLLQASGYTEEDAYFEVYDYDEAQWDRIVYRHKVQEITPRLIGWWKLNEGVGNTVDDASGNCRHGVLASRNNTVREGFGSGFARVLDEDGDSVWWDETCSPPSAARRRAGDGIAASPFFPFGSNNDTVSKPESLWGYKFYVIPHFSMETIGRRRFQSPLVRFGESSHNLLPRHDQQLIKYINKKGQSKELSVTQLLHGPWSDIAPQENELVRWPALMEFVTATGNEAKVEKVESKSPDSQASDTVRLTRCLVDGHGRLSKRFKVLQEFNAAIYRLLPFIAFHAPGVDAFDTSTHEKKWMLSDLVMEQRHRILSVVKRTVWDSALGRTNESGVSFELTLNRPKAMRFRASGKTDGEGRHTLFSQAFRQLQALDGSHFRREDALYHVIFLGENAQDAGGPYRETFAQYCEELQSSQLPLMLPTPNSQHNVGVGREKWLLSPGAQSSTALQMLEFLGKLMGASIRSKQYLALNLAPLVWKKLAGERLALDDLAAVDSMLVNSMSKMRTIDRYGVTEEMFEDIVMETFTTLGADNKVIELKPDGAHLPVTFSSRCEYADLVELARLHESDEQARAIFRGLAKVVPANLLACFSGAELELMVCGSPEVDVDLLEKCTEYSSCSPLDDHIIWFWRALRGFSHEERSAFLRFVWGRSRLPASADEFPQRFKLQSFNQQRAGRSVDAYMPVAHTCFFSIEIPAYSSESILCEKLLYAIYNCQEIDGDGDSVAANQLGWEE